MMAILSQRSQRKKDPKAGWEDIIDDVGALVRTVNLIQGDPLWLSGPRVISPIAGSVTVYLVSRTATLVSTAINNHTIGAKRNGQPLDTSNDIKTWNGTAACEWPAFSMRVVGTGQVAAGDEIRPYITLAGAPAPSLTVDDITLLLRIAR